MIVATLARKPLKGTAAHNAAKHGAGGLRIDACRVAPTGERLGGGDEAASVLEGKESGWSRPWMKDSDKAKAFAAAMRERVERATVLGRWPANLVLVHSEGCRRLGVKRVEGNRTDGRPEGDGGRADKTNWRFRPTDATRRGYSDEDGIETVEAWECVPGCPAQEMDRQSGTTRNGAVRAETPAYPGDSVTPFVRGISGPGNQRADSGGASRFFTQVKK